MVNVRLTMYGLACNRNRNEANSIRQDSSYEDGRKSLWPKGHQ